MKKLNKIYALLTLLFLTFGVSGQVSPSCEFDDLNKIKKPIITHMSPVFDTSLLDRTTRPPVTPLTQDRHIMWVHGLGGDEYAWLPAMNNVDHGSQDATFPARKTKSTTMTYTAGDISMRDCALNVFNRMRDFTDNQSQGEKSRNMLIAHSQGSIVSRTLNMEKEGYPGEHNFGGIAFFVGPQGGAQILNSAKTGEGGKFAAWACNLLLEPRIRTTMSNLPGLVKLFLNENQTTKVVSNIVCDTLIGKSLSKFFVDQIAGQYQTDAYVPNATHLNNLVQYENNPSRAFRPHRVNFASEEPDEGYLIWRTVNYFLHPSIRHENFSANADNGPSTIKWDIDSVQMVYETNALMHKENYELYKLLHPEPNPLLSTPDVVLEYYIIHKPKINELHQIWQTWDNAQEFFDKANDRWKVIIGGRTQKKDCSVVVTQEDVDQYNNPIHYTHTMYFPEIISVQGCKDKGLEISAWPYVISATPEFGFNGNWEEQPSDGIVTLQSQMSLPGQTMEQQYLYNSSHMQIRNDNNLKVSLRALFDGTITIDSGKPEQEESRKWFITDIK